MRDPCRELDSPEKPCSSWLSGSSKQTIPKEFRYADGIPIGPRCDVALPGPPSTTLVIRLSSLSLSRATGAGRRYKRRFLAVTGGQEFLELMREAGLRPVGQVYEEIVKESDPNLHEPSK